MNKLIIGAAGLLLSGTALAAVGAKNAQPLDGSMIHNATLIDWPAKQAVAGTEGAAKSFADVGTKQVPEQAHAEAPSTLAMTDTVDAAPKAAQEGMGGPEETVTTTAVETSWPACAPGPGDDNCIQLYEPGVRAAYAAWQAGHGVPGTEQTAMGGPEEPVEGSGPLPAATADDYPPCRSRADDRCIQLGEHETLAMGGPEEAVIEPASAESPELAAYEEPLPEDLVLPASEEVAFTDAPTRSGDTTMAI